ncbi:hypothetical protein BG55_15490 [Erwinia mallotivora]|uniref:Uncharacterized protein n=1 Tax=Erwinia mallotivora TaxID=69222 RepID=A0A014M9F2_9GAMM|nr:hypothetical protein BG55_15490 [Erwinia mallotivora]
MSYRLNGATAQSLAPQQTINNRLIRGVTPYPPHATKALQAWLNLRFEPQFIIMAAVGCITSLSYRQRATVWTG